MTTVIPYAYATRVVRLLIWGDCKGTRPPKFQSLMCLWCPEGS